MTVKREPTGDTIFIARTIKAGVSYDDDGTNATNSSSGSSSNSSSFARALRLSPPSAPAGAMTIDDDHVTDVLHVCWHKGTDAADLCSNGYCTGPEINLTSDATCGSSYGGDAWLDGDDDDADDDDDAGVAAAAAERTDRAAVVAPRWRQRLQRRLRELEEAWVGDESFGVAM